MRKQEEQEYLKEDMVKWEFGKGYNKMPGNGKGQYMLEAKLFLKDFRVVYRHEEGCIDGYI